MDFPEEMRNFIEIPPALRPPAPANEALRLNPSGRPVLAEVEARAVPVRNATQRPAAPVPAPLCVYACAAPASLCAETIAARGGGVAQVQDIQSLPPWPAKIRSAEEQAEEDRLVAPARSTASHGASLRLSGRVQLVRRDGRDVSTLYGREAGVGWGGAPCRECSLNRGAGVAGGGGGAAAAGEEMAVQEKGRDGGGACRAQGARPPGAVS
jgi:hypothetical protein